MRLDKFLAHVTGNSRSDVKKFLKQKKVRVDGAIITSPGFQVDVDRSVVTAFDEELFYQQFVYVMMNKPKGYLSATKDGADATVMELLDAYYDRFDLSIAGRLDKDTEGLLLLTNDGQFLHEVITPKKRVYKKYLAQIEGELTVADITALENGVVIKDGKDAEFTTAPARVNVVASGEVEIEICEGKFHQVRRMFASVGCRVVYLKRLSIGGLALDEYLELGEYRELSEEELDEITKNT
ncbi:MAG: 16S rRNA pseudouridine(516) synthase [Turicibacter sp.]|nr:16S rRNA pseudouridine(516) synthase [Turicibacter sp.]